MIIAFQTVIYFIAVCNIALYADDTTLYSKCDQASWQMLELASELKSDLQDTVTFGGKRLLIPMMCCF